MSKNTISVSTYPPIPYPLLTPNVPTRNLHREEISDSFIGFRSNRKNASPVPPGQRVFPEGLKASPSRLPNHGSSSEVFNCNQFLSFEMLPDFPYFL